MNCSMTPLKMLHQSLEADEMCIAILRRFKGRLKRHVVYINKVIEEKSNDTFNTPDDIDYIISNISCNSINNLLPNYLHFIRKFILRSFDYEQFSYHTNYPINTTMVTITIITKADLLYNQKEEWLHDKLIYIIKEMKFRYDYSDDEIIKHCENILLNTSSKYVADEYLNVVIRKKHYIYDTIKNMCVSICNCVRR